MLPAYHVGQKKPYQQHVQQRANILPNMHDLPASEDLQAYSRRLEEYSSIWDIDASTKSHFQDGGTTMLLKTRILRAQAINKRQSSNNNNDNTTT